MEPNGPSGSFGGAGWSGGGRDGVDGGGRGGGGGWRGREDDGGRRSVRDRLGPKVDERRFVHVDMHTYRYVYTCICA